MKKTLTVATLLGCLSVASMSASADIVVEGTVDTTALTGTAQAVIFKNNSVLQRTSGIDLGSGHAQIGSLTLEALTEGVASAEMQVTSGHNYGMLGSNYADVAMTLNGGTLTMSGDGTFMMVNVVQSTDDTGTIKVTGGTMKVQTGNDASKASKGLNASGLSLDVSGTGTFDVSQQTTIKSATVHDGGSFIVNNANLTLDSLTVNTGGTLTVNTQTTLGGEGSVSIDGGKLIVNKDLIAKTLTLTDATLQSGSNSMRATESFSMTGTTTLTLPGAVIGIGVSNSGSVKVTMDGVIKGQGTAYIRRAEIAGNVEIQGNGGNNDIVVDFETALTRKDGVSAAVLTLNKGTTVRFNAESANVFSSIVKNDGTMNVNQNTEVTALTSSAGTTNIANGKTLTVRDLTLSGGSIAGAGTLKIKNSTHNGTISADLSLVNSGTTLWLEEVKGGLIASTGTIAANIKLRNGDWAGAEWTSADRDSYTFTGSFSNGGTGDKSAGNFGIDGVQNITYTFKGDMAAWTGILRSASGSTMNVNIDGTLTTAVGADIRKNNGTLNLNVKRDTSFTNAVNVSSVSLDAGTTVSSTNNTFSAESVVLASGSSLTLTATNRTLGSLTLDGGTITLGSTDSDGHDYNLITSSLAVSGTGSTMNANLVMNSGVMSFANDAVLTMGCTVSIGDAVIVVLTQEMVDSIAQGNWVEIIDSVEGIATLGHTSFTGASGVTLDQPTAYHLTQIGDKIYITPEPATATLSLLALAGLCARRRRH